MSVFLIAFLLTAPVAILVLSVLTARRAMKKSGSGRTAMQRHFVTLAVSVGVMVLFTVVAQAADAGGTETTEAAAEAAKAVAGDAGLATGLALIAGALAMGLSGIGAGLALASGVPAAIGATSEDPSAFGKALIFVALGEAVALYGLIVAMMIVLKVPNLPAL